jgi:SAM-dependent methyltransferase
VTASEASQPKAGQETFASSMASAVNYHRWIADVFRPYVGRAVVEIGIGHGALYEYLPRPDLYVGTDLDLEMVEAARARFPGRRFSTADIADTELHARFAGLGVDTVICVNVLEHVQDDRAAVANMLRVLEPGGHLLLFVPAFQALYNEMDRLAGHVRRYTTADLGALFQGSGASVVRLDYFNAIGGVGWWVNRLAKPRSLETSTISGQIALFDRYILPLSRRVDPLTRRWFGQSGICIARKS